MKKKRPQTPGIPATGQILRYLVRAIGLPTKDIPGISDKDFERLDSQVLSAETAHNKIKAIVDRIVLPDSGAYPYTPSKTALADMLNPQSPFSTHFSHDAEGAVIFDPNELARLIWDFLYMSSIHRVSLGKKFIGVAAFESWLTGFVIPFLAGHMAELRAIGVNWETGMPGGQHWYLPAERKLCGANNREAKFQRTPVQRVLRWWEDLLGHPLDELSHKLCPSDTKGISAARQIRNWLTDGTHLSFTTIENWTHEKVIWNYGGVFKATPQSPLRDQWEECRAFLIRKDMIWRPQKLDAHPNGLPAQHFEPLEWEIPPFTNAGIPFSKFFETDDPIADGLPVEEFIRRVAFRWSPPTNPKLRARLLIASAAQRAASDMCATIPAYAGIILLHDFERIYNDLLPILNSPEVEAAGKNPRPVVLKKLLLKSLEDPRQHRILTSIFDEDIRNTTAMLWEIFEDISSRDSKNG